jgi:BNR repeat-like domain
MKNLVFCTLIIISAAGCGGGGNATVTAPADTNSPSVAAKTSAFAAGDTDCPYGGILVETGIDSNKNNILDAGEVSKSQKVCNGTPGVTGSPGTTGATGAKGADGVLGTNGTNGLSALVKLTQEAAGTNCLTGGVRIDIGMDTSTNGILDANEITSTAYSCNGATGATGAAGSVDPAITERIFPLSSDGNMASIPMFQPSKVEQLSKYGDLGIGISALSSPATRNYWQPPFYTSSTDIIRGKAAMDGGAMLKVTASNVPSMFSGLWLLNEGTGTTVGDSSSAGITGTFFSTAPTWLYTSTYLSPTESWRDSQRTVRGIQGVYNSYVDFGNVTVLNGKTQWSVLVGYKSHVSSTAVNATIFSKWQTGSYQGFILRQVSDGTLKCYVGGTTLSYSGVTIDTDYVILVTLDGTNATMYVNGVQAATAAFTAAFPAGVTEKLSIGQTFTNGTPGTSWGASEHVYFAGLIARSITAAERTELFAYTDWLMRSKYAYQYKGNPVREALNHPLSSGQQRVVVTDDSMHNAFPGCTKLANGNYLLIYRKAIAHGGATPDISVKGDIYGKFSTDQGLTWGTETLIHSDATYDLRDPSITTLNDGTLMITCFLYNQSNNTRFANGIVLGTGNATGSSWSWAVPSLPLMYTLAISSPVIQLPSGRIYMAYYGTRINGDAKLSVATAYSDDYGATWTERLLANGVTAGFDYDEPNIMYMGGSSLLVLIRTGDGTGFTQQVWSNNLGVTFTAPIHVAFLNSPPRFVRHSSGVLMAVGRAGIGGGNSVALLISRDAGQTWERNALVNLDDTVSSGFSTMTYASPVEISGGILMVPYGIEYNTLTFGSSNNSDIRVRFVEIQ